MTDHLRGKESPGKRAVSITPLPSRCVSACLRRRGPCFLALLFMGSCYSTSFFTQNLTIPPITQVLQWTHTLCSGNCCQGSTVHFLHGDSKCEHSCVRHSVSVSCSLFHFFLTEVLGNGYYLLLNTFRLESHSRVKYSFNPVSHQPEPLLFGGQQSPSECSLNKLIVLYPFYLFF